jgi:REP element-mobilizing transposase RayT
MARKPRIQYEGALYHIYNRGNYRSDIYGDPRTAAAFEACLFEVCERMDWRLHAYTLMRNHFHLALETMRPNLVEGMHWLQSTFAVRFNRFRNERGHLFQGRYHALLVERGPALARVVNYIHLNPVRARLVPVGQLRHYRWSSYGRFVSGPRPEFLVCAAWLRELGLDDTDPGWHAYESFLDGLIAEKNGSGTEKFTQGWAIGSPDWRKAVAKDHRELLGRHRLGSPALTELKQIEWSTVFEALLTAAGRTEEEAKGSPKGAPWKIGMADQLRRMTTATLPWIARKLHMGSSSAVSVYLCRARKIKK